MAIRTDPEVAKTREWRQRIRPWAENESAIKALQSFISPDAKMSRKGMYTLEIINNLIQSETYGKTDLFKRLPPEACRGMLEGGRRLVQASVICRAYGGTDEEKSRNAPEARFGGYSALQSVIGTWSERDGCWDETPEATLLQKGYKHNPDYDGSEAHVFRKEGQVVKTITFLKYSHFELMMDRIAIHNAVFPEMKMTVRGFGMLDNAEDNTGFVVQISQPWANGRAATPEEIDRGMAEVGYDKTDFILPTYISKTGNTFITDVGDLNCVISESGKFYCFDNEAYLSFIDVNLAKPQKVPFSSLLPDKTGKYDEKTWKDILGDEYKNFSRQKISEIVNELRKYGRYPSALNGNIVCIDNPERKTVNIDGRERVFYDGDILYGPPSSFVKSLIWKVPEVQYDEASVEQIVRDVNNLMPVSIRFDEFIWNKNIVGKKVAEHYGGTSERKRIENELHTTGRVHGLLNDRYIVQVDPEKPGNVLVSTKDNVEFMLWTKDTPEEGYGKLSAEAKKWLAQGYTIGRGNEEYFFNIDKGRVDKVSRNPLKLAITKTKDNTEKRKKAKGIAL